MADPPLNPLMMFRKSWQYFKRRAGLEWIDDAWIDKN